MTDLTRTRPAQAVADSLPAVLPQGQARLDHLGVIRVQGADAYTFLQGQLSNDVLLLPPGQARLAAYCSPKGRVLASFVVYKSPQSEGAEPELLLLAARDVLAATLKRLSMFVLRAKVRLSDASADYLLCGVQGASNIPDALPAEPWSTVAVDTQQVLIRLHAVRGQPRALLLGRLPVAAAAQALPALSLADWQWVDTLSGVPLVAAALADQLVPQMLNYESTGGISFKKGCYPGQEVVARSQFRGTLKRRLYLVCSEGALRPGQDVLNGPAPDAVTGLVVQAAQLPACEPPIWVAAVSVQIAAAESAAGLYVAGPDGAAAQALALLERPYALLDNL
jgi:folate-binding protein YgfZ